LPTLVITIPNLETFLFCQHNSTGGGNLELRQTIYIGFAISIETPPVDCQFGNAANMFSNFLTIIANLDFC
jgi:hypothetical protein